MCVQTNAPGPHIAAKQHELTYYMQRDGIVKSVGGPFRPGAGLRLDCRSGVKTAKRGGAAPFLPRTDTAK
jgi:hypothetical protein